jgi:hypothetical protein
MSRPPSAADALKLLRDLTTKFSPSHWKRWGFAKLNINEADFNTLIAALKAYRDKNGPN